MADPDKLQELLSRHVLVRSSDSGLWKRLSPDMAEALIPDVAEDQRISVVMTTEMIGHGIDIDSRDPASATTEWPTSRRTHRIIAQVEAEAALPRMAAQMLGWAAKLLPGTTRKRWLEEWRGELYDLRVEGESWPRRAAYVADIVFRTSLRLAVTLRLRRGRAVK